MRIPRYILNIYECVCILVKLPAEFVFVFRFLQKEERDEARSQLFHSRKCIWNRLSILFFRCFCLERVVVVIAVFAGVRTHSKNARNVINFDCKRKVFVWNVRGGVAVRFRLSVFTQNETYGHSRCHKNASINLSLHHPFKRLLLKRNTLPRLTLLLESHRQLNDPRRILESAEKRKISWPVRSRNYFS